MGINAGNICDHCSIKNVNFKDNSQNIPIFVTVMDIDTLHGLMMCPLFKGLDENEIIELMHTVRYRVLRYRKGQVFSQAGDLCLHADIIISGEMTAYLVGPTERVIRMTMHHSGNMLAPAFLFAKDNHYPVAVEASADAQVLRLQSVDMEKLLHSDQRLMLNFIGILSNIVSYLTKKVGLLSMNIREKVCMFLNEQQREQQTRNLCMPFSRQQMAELFGIQKYSLQRCLNELQQEGIIRIEGKNIEILKKGPIS